MTELETLIQQSEMLQEELVAVHNKIMAEMNRITMKYGDWAELTFARTPLTMREKVIADLIVQGKTNKEIGVVLGVSERTVKFHVSALFRKTGLSDRKALCRATLNTGQLLEMQNSVHSRT